MVAVGFVLISAKTNKEQTIYKKLKKIPEILELYPIFGEYDFLAKVEVKEFNDIETVVTGKIRKVEGVVHTNTFISTRFE